MKMLCLCALYLRKLGGERLYIQCTDRDGGSVEWRPIGAQQQTFAWGPLKG